jgi:hypothetical protein
MQYDRDLNGEFKEIFSKLREILLSYDEMSEKRNAKQTAYYDSYSAVGFLRPHNDGKRYCLSLAKGGKLQKTYPFLEGDGKIAKHLYFCCVREIDEVLIRAIIEETMVLNMEAYELKKLKKEIYR